MIESKISCEKATKILQMVKIEKGEESINGKIIVGKIEAIQC